MKTFKIIFVLVLIHLNINAKPRVEQSIIETIKTKIVCPAELFKENNSKSIRLHLYVNSKGKAENVIINAEDQNIKMFVNEKLDKLEFIQRNKEINVIVNFKLS